MIALSYGIKISAVRHLVLSQCTRVTDGQTDRRTDRITTPKTALAYARAVETDEHEKSVKYPIVRVPTESPMGPKPRVKIPE